jgi:hypothetical protein
MPPPARLLLRARQPFCIAEMRCRDAAMPRYDRLSSHFTRIMPYDFAPHIAKANLASYLSSKQKMRREFARIT